MKLQITKSLTLAAIGLVLTTVSSPGASYTWDGGGGNGNWSTGANWTGDAAPTGTGHILTFSGSSQTASTNNGQLSVVHGISFAAGAAAFTLSGSNLTLAGDIINSGTATQTIGINLQMATTRIIDTRYGNITVSGNISNDGTNRLLQKEGLGVLELSGSNAWGGRTNLRGGTLLLSGTTPNLVSNELWLGQYDDGNNSVFAVKGGDLTYSGTLASLNRGANVIRAETGVDITFAQASAFTVGTWGTLNFDVSGSNSSIAFSTTAPGLTAGRILQATVTGTNGKTSFAAVDTGAGNKIIALTGLTDISTNPATTTNTNGSLTGGNYNNTQTDRNLNSLTLSGTGGTVTGNNLRPREILMQEGTGNYTFDVRVNPSTASYYLFVHQYSTSGTLTFNAPLLSDDATGGFAKTGLGTVLISASSTSTFTGPSSVQLGTLRVNGALSKVSALDVYEAVSYTHLTLPTTERV
ncbi:MAG: hypothetical protein IAE94_00240, partial [Chthoniobacterales bacterium]|nr:hypothetical protein [Chthoniobacterales bacterium]